MVDLKSHLSVEGKILQLISLENIMVPSGGKFEAPDCWVLHSLLFGMPKLSWRHIVMMNIWDTRETHFQRMIPYVRLISAVEPFA
ncbi:hypothetical protein Hanom_Chr05g00426331 [Helianthus anomalus]